MKGKPSERNLFSSNSMAQSARAVEYTDCIYVEGYDSPNECLGYNTKQSDSEVPVMLDLWGMSSDPALQSFPGSLWPWVVASDRIQPIRSNKTKP